jgi:hypothetical protein
MSSVEDETETHRELRDRMRYSIVHQSKLAHDRGFDPIRS